MPRRASLGAVLALLTGLVFLAPATPAAAADPCCSASLSNVPGQITAGAPPQIFTASMRYTSPDQQHPFRTISAVFTLQTQDVSGGQTQMSRQRPDGSWHGLSLSRHGNEIVATDTYELSDRAGMPGSGGTLNANYRLSFGSKVPSQTVRMSFAMVVRASSGHGTNQVASAGPYPIGVIGGTAPPAPTQAPAPTPTPSPTPATQTQAASAPPANVQPALAAPTIGGTDAGSGTSSTAWIAYIVGGLLLIGGIGVVGTMLWRRNAHPAPVDPYADGYAEDPYAPTYGPPPGSYTPAAPTMYGPAPTAVYPTMAPGAQPTTVQPMLRPDGRPYLDPTRQMPRQ